MKYEYWFAKIQGINLRKKIRLRQCMKTAEAIYYIEETQLKKIEFLNESEQDKILKAKRQDPEKKFWKPTGMVREFVLFRILRMNIRKN